MKEFEEKKEIYISVIKTNCVKLGFLGREKRFFGGFLGPGRLLRVAQKNPRKKTKIENFVWTLI